MRTGGCRREFREKRSDCGRGGAHRTGDPLVRPAEESLRQAVRPQSVRMLSESGLPAGRQAWGLRRRTARLSTVRPRRPEETGEDSEAGEFGSAVDKNKNRHLSGPTSVRVPVARATAVVGFLHSGTDPLEAAVLVLVY